MNKDIIREKLEILIDPSRGGTLKELNAIKHIGIDFDRNIVILIIAIGEMGGESEKWLRHNIAKIIKLDLGYLGVKIHFEEDKRPISQKTKFIIIASGKGGVGKSFITANLAYALKRQDKKVAIIDADIYSASLPKVMNITEKNVEINEQEKIIPIIKDGISVMSIAFFSEPNKPIIWQGDQLKTIINSFFNNVLWDKDIDYVLIDTPSGTGDVMLALKKIVPLAEIILVTTPDILDADMCIKTGLAYQEMHQKILGIVENKTNFINEYHQITEELSHTHSTQEVSKHLNLEVLVSIPYILAKNGGYIYTEDENNAKLFADLATFILIQ